MMMQEGEPGEQQLLPQHAVRGLEPKALAELIKALSKHGLRGRLGGWQEYIKASAR